MTADSDRHVEIAQGISEIYKIAKRYNLIVNAESWGSDSGESWFTVYDESVGDIVGVCDAVETSFDGELGSVSEQDMVGSIAYSNGWDVDEDNNGQLIIYTNVYNKEIV